MTELRSLVLNKNYMPLSLFPLYSTPATDAIRRYLAGNCEVVEWHDRKIKTPSRDDLYWPSVIVNSSSKNFMKNEVKLRKDTLLLRDRGECFWCGSPITVNSMTEDHVVPKSKGGAKGGWLNLVASCKKCNTEKGDNLPVGKWKPKKPVYAPNFLQLMELRKNHPVIVDHENWIPYLPGFATENIIVKPR